MTPRDVSVIIPALNEGCSIARAIESVGDAGQVTVVDGGSRDATVEIASRYPLVEVIRSQAGRGIQLHCGANASQGSILLFLHADCVLAPGTLSEIAAAISNPIVHRIGIHNRRGSATLAGWGAIKQRIDSPQFAYRVLEWGNALRVRARHLPFGDQAIFVRASWYHRVGGFEPLPLMEDLRLSAKLRRLGRPLLLQGPVQVDPRRWQRRGILRQTALNVTLQGLHAAGVAPERLATWYRSL